MTISRRLQLAGWLLAVSVGLAAPAAAQFGGGERKLVAQFDKDGDKRLNRAERAAARAVLGDQSGGGRGGGWGRYNQSEGKPGVKLAPAQVTAYPPTRPFYDPTALRTLFLQFENADWEAELVAFNDTDVEVPAMVTVDNQVFRDVGVHFRGASSFRSVGDGSKRSLNLDFDFVEKGQKVVGYNSLNLLNANNDPTFLRTVLYSQIARDYIPAPKVNYVRVAINGEDWGIYQNAQQFNRDFLREFFPGKDGGARFHIPGNRRGGGGLNYLGENAASYKQYYEIKTKDDPKDWARLIELTRILAQTPPARLEAALAPILDVDGALKFLALDVALVNSDGYWARASDYNLYLDTDGRFHVIPHDMNEALGGNATLDPLVGLTDESKPLRAKLLAVPALRERYLRYVRAIAQSSLDWSRLGPIASRHQALIADAIALDTRKLYSTAAFKGDVPDLKAWMDERRSFLLQ